MDEEADAGDDASMMRVRWSTVKAKFTVKPLMAIQGAADGVEDLRGARARQHGHREPRARPRGVREWREEQCDSGDRRARQPRPRVPLRRKPAKGRSGIHQRVEAGIVGLAAPAGSLELHQVDLVDV